MATINFWQRLANLWGGFVSLWISDVEKKHPEIAYENAINSMVDKYTRLKSATASIIRRRDEIDERLGREQSELRQVLADLDTAVATDEDELAMVLLQKKAAIEAEITTLQQELEQAKSDADDAKASLMSVKAEIGKLKSEKDRMLAKMSSAEARLRIQRQVEGLSVDAEVKALENVREHIKNTISEANLGKEIDNADLDSRLAALRRQTGDVNARQQLAALKKAAKEKAQLAERKM